MSKFVPEYTGKLRKMMLEVPKEIYRCSGIKIFGRRIKSIVFSTDMSIIRNTNADAIMAVYPFSPQPVITRSIMNAADLPVFCGVGGGLTRGQRVVNLALEAEQQGAMGIVVNAPTPNDTIEHIAENIDIPIVITVVRDSENFQGRIDAGASIFNVSAAAKTPEIVSKIRKEIPKATIIATGGPTSESVQKTVEAGANAITWTPPSSREIFTDIMETYRQGKSPYDKDYKG